MSENQNPQTAEQPETAPATHGNQTEAEFFASVAVGRKGLDSVALTLGPKIQEIALPSIRQSFSLWMQRAIVSIANDDNLKDVIRTRQGLFSIYQTLARASTMGLQIGGQYPHAYLVPKAGLAVLMPAAVGLTYISAHGPGAVLKYPPEVRPVYANDKLKIDPVGGKIGHEFNPLADRGKLVLWYTKLEYIDGRVEIPYVKQDDVELIEKNYGNTNSPAYKKSLMDMHLKTATKKLLKRPASESEGLAMALADDDAAEMEPVRTVEPSPPRDVGERMADRLDKAVDKIKPAEKIEEQEEDEAPGQDERHADDTPPPEGNDLF